MRGRYKSDPYRRPFAMLGLSMAAPAAFLVFQAFANGVGARPDRPGWGEFLALIAGFEILLGVYLAVFFVSPRVRAVEQGGARIVRMPPWRRMALAIGYPFVGWPLSAWAFLRGDVVPGVVVILATALFTSVLLLTTRDRIRIDAEGLLLFRGRAERVRIGWRQVTGVHAMAAAVRIDADGRRIPVPGLLLDGYPELVSELLSRVPPETIDASPGARIKLERVAALAR